MWQQCDILCSVPAFDEYAKSPQAPRILDSRWWGNTVIQRLLNRRHLFIKSFETRRSLVLIRFGCKGFFSRWIMCKKEIDWAVDKRAPQLTNAWKGHCAMECWIGHVHVTIIHKFVLVLGSMSRMPLSLLVTIYCIDNLFNDHSEHRKATTHHVINSQPRLVHEAIYSDNQNGSCSNELDTFL